MTICVIGGGAAGMMAAGVAASLGHSVLLYEKNPILGKKLLITGKGRCNVTNSCSNEDFIANVVTNGRFLYSAISAFNCEDTKKFFEELGVPLKTERGNRVFPVSDRSSDIVFALKKYIKNNNVRIVNLAVKDIIAQNNQIKGIVDERNNEVLFDKVIICTGGISYKLTGSTGDGYYFAKALGHTVTNLKGSLIPLEAKEKWVKELQGITLKNVKVSLIEKEQGKVIFSDFGEMLFTHFGVSGPVILSISSHMKDFKPNLYEISIDLKPALSFEMLDSRILRDFSKYINKDIKNALHELLIQKLIPVVLRLANIPFETKVNELSKEKRFELAKTIKGLSFTVSALRPIEEAIITSGGVAVNEISPKTMESKIIKGLYFAGEVIDVDAYTGGFNLQIAFSTAFLAAKSL